LPAAFPRLKALRFSGLPFALLKLAVMVFAVIGVFFQDLSLVFADALQYAGYSYILLIPALIAYLLYRKRNMLAAAVLNEDRTHENTRHLPAFAGFLLCMIAFAVYIFGSQTFSPLQYHLVSLPILVAGLTLFLFNPLTLRQALFPIVFLIFLTPMPLIYLNSAGALLSAGSTVAANTFVNLFGIQSWISVVSGTPAINLVSSDNQPLLFIVDIACSGIYSILGFVVFATFIAYIVRDNIWKKLAIVIIGFLLIYFLNVIRITTIVLIGYLRSTELALELFHIMGGWVLVFVGTIILLVASEKIFKTKIFTKSGRNSQNSISHPNARIYSSLTGSLEWPKKRVHFSGIIKTAVIFLVTLLVASTQTPVFASVRGPGPIMVQTSYGQQGNLQLFPQMEDYTLRFLYRDTSFEKLSGQEYSLTFAYYPEKPDDIEVTVLLEVAETSIALHPWEICLVHTPIEQGYQPVAQLDLRDVRVQENPLIVARYFAFKEQNQELNELVLYYFTTALFQIDNTTKNRQVKISFITYYSDPNSLNAMEQELLPFAQKTVNYWEPLRKWNAVTMAISQSVLLLASIAIAVLIALVPLSWFETRRRLRTNASVYDKLHPHKQRIVDAVQETGKTNLATLENTAKTYQQAKAQPVDNDELLKNLIELEEIGILRSKIVNEQDEPVYTWKTQFIAQHFKIETLVNTLIAALR